MGGQNLKILKSGELRATNLINLKVLILTSNSIKTIQLGAFRGENKIEHLYLNYNLIEEIDLIVFKDLSHLEELHLNGNPLKGFSNDDEFPKLDLTLLDLESRKIHSIPPNLFNNLEKLKNPFLYDNQLQALDWKTLQPLKNLQSFYFGKNPFHCGCEINLLLEFLNSKKITWLEYYYVPPSCETSSFLLNKKVIGVEWDKIERELLMCSPEISPVTLKLIIAGLAVVVVLLFGVIITSGIYIYVRYSKTKRNELPTNIYEMIPRESKKPNTASLAMSIVQDSISPPLLEGLENVYEICGNDEDHFYEVPVISPMKLHS